MELNIISPQNKKEFKVMWVELNTPKGNFIIEKGHAPMILTLSPGQHITFELDSGKEISEVVSGGVAHIMRKSVKLLLSS